MADDATVWDRDTWREALANAVPDNIAVELMVSLAIGALDHQEATVGRLPHVRAVVDAATRWVAKRDVDTDRALQQTIDDVVAHLTVNAQPWNEYDMSMAVLRLGELRAADQRESLYYLLGDVVMVLTGRDNEFTVPPSVDAERVVFAMCLTCIAPDLDDDQLAIGCRLPESGFTGDLAELIGSVRGLADP